MQYILPLQPFLRKANPVLHVITTLSARYYVYANVVIAFLKSNAETDDVGMEISTY